MRTCALAIWPARRACPIVRRRRRERPNHPEPRHSTILPEPSAWKKNFTRVDKFLLTWQVSRVSDDGDAFRTGGARLGQLIGTLPTIFCLADVAALRVEQCAGEAAADLFSSSLRCAVDPGYDPGVYLQNRNVHVLASCAARDVASLVLQPRGCGTSLAPKRRFFVDCCKKVRCKSTRIGY